MATSYAMEGYDIDSVEIEGLTFEPFQCQMACALKLFTQPEHLSNLAGHFPKQQLQRQIDRCILRQLGLEEQLPSRFTQAASYLYDSKTDEYRMLVQDVLVHEWAWRKAAKRALQRSHVRNPIIDRE